MAAFRPSSNESQSSHINPSLNTSVSVPESNFSHGAWTGRDIWPAFSVLHLLDSAEQAAGSRDTFSFDHCPISMPREHPLHSDSERQIQSDQIDSDIAFTWSFADLGSFPLLPDQQLTWAEACSRPFWTALLETLILKAPLNPRTLFSLLIGVLGSTLYAMGDANSDLEGVFLVGSNALLVAFTSVCEKYVVRNVDQAALGFSLYRNTVAIPLLWILMTAGKQLLLECLLE
eukprot:symbB.v1.2.028308.t2/scaffold2947.1/size66659/7